MAWPHGNESHAPAPPLRLLGPTGRVDHGLPARDRRRAIDNWPGDRGGWFGDRLDTAGYRATRCRQRIRDVPADEYPRAGHGEEHGILRVSALWEAD